MQTLQCFGMKIKNFLEKRNPKIRHRVRQKNPLLPILLLMNTSSYLAIWLVFLDVLGDD